MKIIHGRKLLYLWGVWVGILLFNVPAHAAGLLTPKDGSVPALEIQNHHVEVIIEDGYAITTVAQEFYNPHGKDLEAIYSFPVPDKGSVSEFTMWIDGKAVQGEVLEKKRARKVYEDQKSKGNETGITEKDSYKTFDISVYPVRAQQSTKIKISYMQPAHVDTGIGRYLYPLQEGGVDEQKLSFWTSQEVVTGAFTFDLILRSDYPVDAVRLPNHPQASITRNGDEWKVHMDNLTSTTQTVSTSGADQTLTINYAMDDVAEVQPQVDSSFRLDTDIVVYYRHVENLPGSVDLVAYKTAADKRGTFMLTVTPGMDIQPITEGSDWVFVLDISGSMNHKYQTLAEGVSQALNKMSVDERFRIVLFNDRAHELTNGFTTATPKNVQHYIQAVKNVQPGNGTNLFSGIKLALDGLDDDRTSSILLVTDGVANVGETKQRRFIKLIESHDVRLFTFIMGNSANRPLLKAVTKASNGFALNVSNSDDIVGKILLAQSKVVYQALHGVKLKISGIKAFDITPKNIGSLYRGQQLVMFGHYYGSGEAEVVLSGKISGEEKRYTSRFDFPDEALDNPEIERLWAYAKIEELMAEMDDFGEKVDLEQAVTDLGEEYSLVTDYTSMVVVADEVFQELGIERRNQKRLSIESNARSIRASKGIKSNRVDTSQPMFNKSRPTLKGFTGGGGAFDIWSVLILFPFLKGVFRKKGLNTKEQDND